MFIFLTVIQGIVAATLVGLILMQRSEGGGLGIGGGGSPGGLMSARGAADFMTRATKWLAVLFVVLAIVLAAMAVDRASGREIDTSLQRPVSDPLADPIASPGAPAPPPDLIPGDPGLDGQAPVSPIPATPSDPLAEVQ